jgi:hypothetical protein
MHLSICQSECVCDCLSEDYDIHAVMLSMSLVSVLSDFITVTQPCNLSNRCTVCRTVWHWAILPFIAIVVVSPYLVDIK